MRAALHLSADDVVVEEVPDPVLVEPTDSVVRVLRSCVCGSDLWAWRATFERAERSRLGHELLGVVEEVGSETGDLRVGVLVIVPFSYSDGTGPACLAGRQTSCPNRGTWGAPGHDGAQGEALRIPHAAANLVVPAGVDRSSYPALLALSDVMATGMHGVRMAATTEGSTVVVVGDGAVGLCAVLGASRLAHAGRVILLSTHAPRAALGWAFGATDVVEARGRGG